MVPRHTPLASSWDLREAVRTLISSHLLAFNVAKTKLRAIPGSYIVDKLRHRATRPLKCTVKKVPLSSIVSINATLDAYFH